MLLKKTSALVVTLALLTSCAGTGPAIESVDSCAGWAPILISEGDILTEETARDILVHNRYGQREGCWSQ